MKYAWRLALVASLGFAACGRTDGAGTTDGGGGGGVDGGDGGGGGGGAPGSGETGSETVPCTPHTFACGSNDDVEVCNNAGTAWLYDHSCAVGCSDGVCTDPTCTPGATQCAGNAVQTCGADGATWTTTQTCSTYCQLGECALEGLTVGSDASYSGTVIVAGDVDVAAGATLTAASGDLTIIANNITVEASAAIAVAPTSTNIDGASCGVPFCDEYGCYGSFGVGGDPGAANYGEPWMNNLAAPFGGDSESSVAGGGNGGAGGALGCYGGNVTTFGGGTLRLLASGDVKVAGQLFAPGGPVQTGDASGGAGGGIEIAGDTVEISGTLTTPGGGVGTVGLPAGYGRIRLMYGTSLTNTGSDVGAITQGVLPPLDVTSPTLPNPALVYNDDFETLAIAHDRPFSTVQGYMHTVDQVQYNVPTAATGTFTTDESFEIPASSLGAGSNYVHVIAFDAASEIGTVETTFPVTINSTPPAVASSTHPSPTTWYASTAPLFAWTLPVASTNVTRFHYVFDQYGNTVPTTADPALPLSQPQMLFTGVADGIWALHVVAEDTVGHLTKVSGTAIVRVGPDPGEGTVFGTVVDPSGNMITGAQVLVNRGIFTGATASGSYSISSVAAGTWEISVVYPGYHVAPQTVTVMAGENASAAFTLIQD